MVLKEQIKKIKVIADSSVFTIEWIPPGNRESVTSVACTKYTLAKVAFVS